MEGLGSAKMALELFHTAREGAAALTSGTVGSRFVDNTHINQLAEGIGINTDEDSGHGMRCGTGKAIVWLVGLGWNEALG